MLIAQSIAFEELRCDPISMHSFTTRRRRRVFGNERVGVNIGTIKIKSFSSRA